MHPVHRQPVSRSINAFLTSQSPPSATALGNRRSRLQHTAKTFGHPLPKHQTQPNPPPLVLICVHLWAIDVARRTAVIATDDRVITRVSHRPELQVYLRF